MKKIARRQFLKTTAAVSVLGAVTSAGAVPAGACIDLSQAHIPALDPFRLDGTFTGSDGHTFSYASYEPAGAKGAPLVVRLHSGEECGTDVRIPLLAEKVTALAVARPAEALTDESFCLSEQTTPAETPSQDGIPAGVLVYGSNCAVLPDKRSLLAAETLFHLRQFPALQPVAAAAFIPLRLLRRPAPPAAEAGWSEPPRILPRGCWRSPAAPCAGHWPGRYAPLSSVPAPA